MSSIERRQDPTSRLLWRLATDECARFRGRNLRQPGRERRVHAVEFRRWIAELKLPVPACRQPINSLALAQESLAVREEVTCERCLALPHERRTGLVVLDGGQLPLPLPDDPDESASGDGC